MTCVWDGLIKALKLEITPEIFLAKLQKNNTITTNIMWNEQFLREQELKENYDQIKELAVSINGYECSSCDALLLLVCQLYNCSIVHDYCGFKITYTNINNPKCILRFRSSSSHFWHT